MGFDLKVKNGDFKQDEDGNMFIRNDVEDGDFSIYVNDGGTDTLALSIDGASAALSLSAGLEVADLLTLSGTVTSAIDVSGATITNLLALTDGEGATVGSMTAKSPETDAEAGFITIDVGGTTYEIPFYAIV